MNIKINGKLVSVSADQPYGQEIIEMVNNPRDIKDMAEHDFTEDSIANWYNDAKRSGKLSLSFKDTKKAITPPRHENGPMYTAAETAEYFSSNLNQSERYHLKSVCEVWNQGVLSPLFGILQAHGDFLPI